MKRILFISSQPFFQWRGSPIRVGFDVQALAEMGFQVDLLTLPVGEDKEIPGVTIFRVANLFGSRNVPIGPSLLKAWFDLLLLRKAFGLFLRRRYDVVHCVEDTGIIGVILSAIFRRKLVFEKHSDPSSYRKGLLRNLIMRLYAMVERFTVRHADAAIGTGPGLARQMREMTDRAPVHEIFDVPSSLTEAKPERARDIRGKLTKREDEMLITYVGSFAVYQGVDLMFNAMPVVVRKRPDARFVVVGGTQEEISERTKWLAEQGIETSVTFPGKMPPDELPDFLAASDILLSPRLAGVNTPLKLLDYMKAGRAIVATDSEANRLILDENTAVFTDAHPSAFAEGICGLLDDRNLRERMGKNSRKLFEQKYDFGEFKNRLARCYDELFARM